MGPARVDKMQSQEVNFSYYVGDTELEVEALVNTAANPDDGVCDIKSIKIIGDDAMALLESMGNRTPEAIFTAIEEAAFEEASSQMAWGG